MGEGGGGLDTDHTSLHFNNRTPWTSSQNCHLKPTPHSSINQNILTEPLLLPLLQAGPARAKKEREVDETNHRKVGRILTPWA